MLLLLLVLPYSNGLGAAGLLVAPLNEALGGVAAGAWLIASKGLLHVAIKLWKAARAMAADGLGEDGLKKSSQPLLYLE